MFKVEDLVILSTKNLKLDRLSRKLTYRLFGLFAVKEPIGSQAYRLHLPTYQRIYPTFYISILEPYYKRNGEDIPNTTPLELLDTEQVQEIETILNKTIEKGQILYLVKQAGQTNKFNSQVKYNDVNTSDLIRKYDDKYLAKYIKRGRGRLKKV